MKSFHTRRLAAVAAAALLALGGAACGGDDDNGGGQASGETGTTAPDRTDPQARFVQFTGGETTLRLSPDLTEALDAVGVDVAPVGTAKGGNGTIRFPIADGRIQNGTFDGTIDHTGGVRFAAAGRGVTAENLVVDTKAKTITAEVDGTRAPVFSLDTSGMERGADGATATASGIEVTLPEEGASTLNDALGVDVLKSGLAVGDLSVRADVNEP